MAFDIEMIKAVYDRMGERVLAARKMVGRPLTLTEKILYTHLTEQLPAKPFERGNSYVDFNPDRVGMQDATAQMASYNLCRPADHMLPFLRQFIVII